MRTIMPGETLITGSDNFSFGPQEYPAQILYTVDSEYDDDGKLIKLGRVFTEKQWEQKKRDDQLAEINRKLDLIIAHLGIEG